MGQPGGRGGPLFADPRHGPWWPHIRLRRCLCWWFRLGVAPLLRTAGWLPPAGQGSPRPLLTHLSAQNFHSWGPGTSHLSAGRGQPGAGPPAHPPPVFFPPRLWGVRAPRSSRDTGASPTFLPPPPSRSNPWRRRWGRGGLRSLSCFPLSFGALISEFTLRCPELGRPVHQSCPPARPAPLCAFLGAGPHGESGVFCPPYLGTRRRGDVSVPALRASHCFSQETSSCFLLSCWCEVPRH